LEEVNDNIQFKITEELLELVQELIETQDDKALKHLLKDYHYADVAEILNELELEDALYVIKLLDSETT
jgi:magnesium transporter